MPQKAVSRLHVSLGEGRSCCPVTLAHAKIRTCIFASMAVDFDFGKCPQGSSKLHALQTSFKEKGLRFQKSTFQVLRSNSRPKHRPSLNHSLSSYEHVSEPPNANMARGLWTVIPYPNQCIAKASKPYT